VSPPRDAVSWKSKNQHWTGGKGVTGRAIFSYRNACNYNIDMDLKKILHQLPEAPPATLDLENENKLDHSLSSQEA
jgi:hypothetical protein